MTFSPIKPDSGPSPKIDVVQIQTDFSTYATIFAQNHSALNSQNQGDHEGIVLELQTQDPGVTNTYDVLYCKNAASHAGTQPQLFVQIPKFLPNQNDSRNVENVPMQLTYNQVNTSGPVYQSFLPGGYLLYLGTTSNIAANITLSPVPTKILSVIATPYQVGANNIPWDVNVFIVSNSQFKINSFAASGVYTFGFVAIAQA